MKDDETLDELQRSLRATHDPARKIRPCSRDCGEIQKCTTGREKKKQKTLGHEAGRCWPACASSKKKKGIFLRAIKTCKPQRLGSVRKPPAELILAEGGGAAGKTVTRQTETISTKSRSRIHKNPVAVSPLSHLSANKIPSVSWWSDRLILKLSSLGPIFSPGWG